MSTTIELISGDKALYISGSANYISRKVNVPSGSSDLRVGICMTLGGGSQTASTQNFNPATIIGETFRHCFTSEGCVPGVTVGSYVGQGHSVGQANCLGRPTDQSMAGEDVSIIFDCGTFNGNMKFISSSLYSMSNPGAGDTEVPIKNSPTTASLNIIRLYKNSATQFQFLYYSKYAYSSPGTSGPSLGLPIQDNSFNTYMNQLNLLNLQRTQTLTFNSADDRDNMFTSMSCVFFSWPYYGFPVYIPYMGYRVT